MAGTRIRASWSISLITGLFLVVTVGRTAGAVELSLQSGCIQPGGEVEVAVGLTNGEPVRGFQLGIQDLPNQLSFVTGAAACTTRAAGFTCQAGEDVAGNVLTTVVLSLAGETIAAGTGPVATVRLRDGGAFCAPGSLITLELTDGMVAGPFNERLVLTTHDVTIACGCDGVTSTTTTSTVTSSSTSTTTSTLPLPCNDDGDCDDGDACTTDVCGAAATCEYATPLPAERNAVGCHLANARRIFAEPPAPACTGKCPRQVVRKIDLFERRLDRGVAAHQIVARCRRILGGAGKLGTALQQRLRRLIAKGRLVPADRGTRLLGEVEQATAATATLRADCGS